MSIMSRRALRTSYCRVTWSKGCSAREERRKPLLEISTANAAHDITARLRVRYLEDARVVVRGKLVCVFWSWRLGKENTMVGFDERVGRLGHLDAVSYPHITQQIIHGPRD